MMQSESGGLSPRMRGNPWSPQFSSAFQRSIPAYAGEPARSRGICRCSRVYPRVCGGTGSTPGVSGSIFGLSPRMRGNLREIPIARRPARSIPAYAGEPSARYTMRRRNAVYPRVCGGTHRSANHDQSSAGLSPRMRGNRVQQLRSEEECGSIPAYAGEPRRAALRAARLWVYPRVCGGTWFRHFGERLVYGLSPRMRGNHIVQQSLDRRNWSIPAYAGEPLGRCRWCWI